MEIQERDIGYLIGALACGEEFSESHEGVLSRLRFAVPSSAWKNLVTLYGQTNFTGLYPDFFSDFLKLLSLSFEPDRGLNNFARFADEILDKNYLYTLLTTEENLLSNLISLFSGSQYLTDLLLKEPETFNWLRLPRVLKQKKLKDQLYRESWELILRCENEEEFYGAVRKFKKREYLRIGLKDLTRVAPLEEILDEISNLADVMLQHCYEFSLEYLVEKHGNPFFMDDEEEEKPAEFAIIAMGKLGGEELNYSSDIDLLYVYTSDRGMTKAESPIQRQISNHEFFTKLGQKITAAMSRLTADGSVFRVDLGLRPEGASGDLVSSIRSYEVYYESWGRTWERMALLKARPSAGSKRLGSEFMEMVRPFVYRKYLDFKDLEDVRDMKERITKDINSARGQASKNVKLGSGGIREIEFIAQVFNLLFGGKDRRIRVNNLLMSLDKLAKHEYISKDERELLREAYIFLRELEHRIQISFGLQTQEFSMEREGLKTLALKMGLKGESADELARALEEEYSRHTGEVRKIYNRFFFFGEIKDSKKRTYERPDWMKIEKEELIEETIAPYPFRDKKKVLKNLLLLRDGEPFSHPSAKSVAQFSALTPKILKAAAKQPDPDQAINNLERFVRRCDGRESLYEMLRMSPDALYRLLAIFGKSELLSTTLINQPYLLDSLFDPEWVHKFKPRELLDKEIATALCGVFAQVRAINNLISFKKGEEFRIGIRYLLKETSYEDMVGDLTTLAELFLKHVLRISVGICSSAPIVPDESGFAIIGMGKLGGREIDYGSDLDLIFVYDEEKRPPKEALGHRFKGQYFSSIGETVCKLASRSTLAGHAYDIDVGLRPEGEKGSLVISLGGFADYLKSRALTWERQSLIKARFVCGDPDVGRKFCRLSHEFVYRGPLSFSGVKDIRRLRKRIEEETKKSEGGKNIKTGPGGLMDIEFIAQTMQLKYGHAAERLRTPSTLDALAQVRRLGYLDPKECEFLADSYLFLRRAITYMRLNRDGPAYTLHRDPEKVEKLSLCMGFDKTGYNEGQKGGDAEGHLPCFMDECVERTRKTRNIYLRAFSVKSVGQEK